ncbi:MAG: NADH-quinone oxidoreductase subunit E [Sulfurimonas sp.]|uniref:complex I 24 kDa subunit family protein n=1 Tax=Sulfurimonas sp. TaxID=2022749 RepID=UPI0039E48673
MFTFTKENLLKIEELKKQYPNPNALNLPCLWMAQYQEGYISIDAIDAIAKTIHMSPMEVYKVATFYTMFHLEPLEKLNVQVCKTLSCKLCRSDDILEHLKSKDVRIQHVECLGSCGTAPVMQINDVFYENLTNEKVDRILKELI